MEIRTITIIVTMMTTIILVAKPIVAKITLTQFMKTLTSIIKRGYNLKGNKLTCVLK